MTITTIKDFEDRRQAREAQAAAPAEERLYSLDLLRGLDMILLVVIGPLVRAADAVWHFPPAFMGQFRHGWECFTFWDIIMPLFIFMCGAAVPFALGRRLENGRAGATFWRHVLVRVVILWVLGMMVQGNLLSLDITKFNPYSNTLQAIAAGYLGAACVMLIRPKALRIAAPIAFAAAYTLLLAFGGDYTEHGNFAYKTDIAALRALLPANSSYLANPNHYTWFTTSLMFAAMTLCGFFATEILRGGGTKRAKAVRLFVYAGVLEAVGWGVSPWIPVIKPIFTLSFTAQAMGWCVLALALLYVLTDILMLRKGLWVVILFGQCALAAYLVGGNLFRPVIRRTAEVFTQGFPHAFGFDKNVMTLVNTALSMVVLTAVLAVWRRIRRKK